MYKCLRKVSSRQVLGNWENDLNFEIQSQKTIFQACFRSLNDNYFKWFQYRIIHTILGTNKLLSQVNITNSVECR